MEKLIKIQSELKAPKGQFNSFGKYKYRSTEDILEALKPLLKKHDCTLIIGDELVMIGDRYYIKATAEIVSTNDSESLAVSAFAREEENKKGMDQSQITGSASSYARKYALNGLFLIDDTKDADGLNNHSDDLKTRLGDKLSKYSDPQNLESDKIALRDEFVKLGMNKKEATDIIMGKLNDF